MESRTMKILMMDDNRDNLTVLGALILEAFPKASVLSALNGREGLDIAAREEPDIVLLDINMPEMDGFEVCRRLKADEQLCDTPVIFITGNRSDRDSRLKALECGAGAFITKPIDEIELTTQIRSMFRIRAANIQKREDKITLAALVENKTRELQEANMELMKTVEAVKREQALLEAIFDSIPGYLYVYNESGKLIKWNKKHEMMTGYSTEELAQMSLDKWFDQEDLLKVNSAVRDVFEKGHGEVEAWLKLKSGGKMLTRSSGVPLVLNGQRYFAGIGVDITEQKRLENALLESQRIAHIGTWSLDLQTNEVIWSEELYRMYGFDPTLPPPPYTEHMKLFTPESWHVLSTSLDYTRTSGIPYELELQTVTKDGSNGWMWVRGEAKTDSTGNIVSLWGAAQDITDRKRIEIELKQSEERFQLLFEKAPLGYQSLDFDGRFIEVNQQWLDTLGYSREEVIGKWFGDFLCPEYVDGFRKRFPIFKAQGFIHSEFEMQAKNGNKIYLSFEGRIGYDVGGNFIQTHCILQDITSRKKAEAALKESEFAERLLLEHLQVAIIVHNTDSSISFCNPLAKQILGFSANQIQNKLVTDKAWHFCDKFGESLLVDSYPFSLVYQNDAALVDYEMGIVFEGSSDIRWVIVNGFNIKDTEGNISKVLISFVEITEKKIAEQALLESEERYKYLFENSGVGIGYYSTDGTVISYNQKALENIGGRLEDYVGKSFFELFQGEQAEIYYSRIKYAISSDIPQVYEDYLVINSQAKWFSSTFTRVTNATGEIIGVQIASLDITMRKQAEEAFAESQTLLKAAFETSQAGIVIVDAPSGKLRYVNKAGLLIRNKTEEEVQKDNDKLSYIKRWNLLHLDGTPYAEEEFILARAFLFGETRSDEFIIQRDDLENRYVLAHAAPIRNPMGVISAGVIVFLDITDKKQAEEKIQHLAYHDYLTDAYNRIYFDNVFAEKNTIDFYPLAIIMGDINGLKLINDSFGHHAGDLAIQQFAIEIRKHIPDDAVLARVGGDEFAVLLTGSSEAKVKKLTGELQSSVRIIIKDNSDNDVDAVLTATFGYSRQSFLGQDMDDLVKEVETFMNRRKFLENTSRRSNVIDAIMSTLFEKSEREQQHSIRVSSIATAIATEMGLDDATVAKTRVAGALHDIGKIGIDESILNKTDRLSDQEWEFVKQHPIRSARILASVDEYLDIVPIVKAHHERVDGCGYPARLTDKQIPIEAKIIAVADSFDAMTVSRPYRDAISKETAAEELKRCAGSQFDQKVVDAFIRAVLPRNDSFASKTKPNH